MRTCKMSTPSSKKWLQRQRKDEFVKQAKKEGIRSRAVYKLREIQQKHNLIKKNMQILELGAAPGSWTEELARIVGTNGQIYAVDRLEMQPINCVDIKQYDIESEEFIQWLEKTVANEGVDIVLSDMAPNMCGHQQTDQLRAMSLCELVIDIAKQCLKQDGCILMKTFQGVGFKEMLTELRGQYKSVSLAKPKASMRSASEVYIVAKGYKHKHVLAKTGDQE